MSAAMPLPAQFGELVSADFDERTMTFELADGFRVAAGEFALLPRDSYEKVVQALAFVVRCHDQLTPSDVQRLKTILAEADGGAS